MITALIVLGFVAVCYGMLFAAVWVLDCMNARRMVSPPWREFWRMVGGQ